MQARSPNGSLRTPYTTNTQPLLSCFKCGGYPQMPVLFICDQVLPPSKLSDCNRKHCVRSLGSLRIIAIILPDFSSTAWGPLKPEFKNPAPFSNPLVPFQLRP